MGKDKPSFSACTILPNKDFDHPLTILLLSHYVNCHYGVGCACT